MRVTVVMFVLRVADTLRRQGVSRSRSFFILNKNVVHLIHDIVWKMGFKTEDEAEKVIFRIIILI